MYAALRFRWLLETWLFSKYTTKGSYRLEHATCNQIFITLCNLTQNFYTCSSNSRSNVDQSALLILNKIHIGSRRPWPVSNSIYQCVCKQVRLKFFLRTFTGHTKPYKAGRICRLRFSCFARLTLKAPITTKFDCFCRLLKCFRSLSNKQCRLRSDWSSLIWVHTVCLYT